MNGMSRVSQSLAICAAIGLAASGAEWSMAVAVNPIAGARDQVDPIRRRD
jgi:hypothetical protein